MAFPNVTLARTNNRRTNFISIFLQVVGSAR
jgi:hypothetical protein